MKGRRGYLSDLAGGHRLFALAALHAARTHVGGKVPDEANFGYVLAFPLAFVPLAILLDWFAVNVAWITPFWILRIIFTIPGVICTLLAIIGLLAWAYVAVYAVVYIVGYITAWRRHIGGK